MNEPEGVATPDAAALSNIDIEQFTELMSQVNDEQLAEMMSSDGRGAVLDEIFGRMAEHVDPAKATEDAVVHFKITGRPDGGFDHYEVAFAGGECSVSDQPSQQPQVTIEVDPVAFLKLAAGRESGPTLFMSGKLKIDGDLMMATRLTAFFKIPGAPSA